MAGGVGCMLTILTATLLHLGSQRDVGVLSCNFALLLNSVCAFASSNWFVSLLPFPHCLLCSPCYIIQVPYMVQSFMTPLTMPALSPSIQYSMQYTAEQGIEYMYFLLQATDGKQDWQAYLDVAAEEYENSGTRASVCKLIKAAFQEHDANLDILCPIFVQVAKENQMSRKLNRKG
ncbi:hypothetical protein EDC04DRAFT_1995361 [Pisolithus marmoratus]|nr:hypothetical protein EDC04DRAFT_1995361 [Pisolithus marmoratus]